jgi:hypothetical protein
MYRCTRFRRPPPCTQHTCTCELGLQGKNPFYEYKANADYPLGHHSDQSVLFWSFATARSPLHFLRDYITRQTMPQRSRQQPRPPGQVHVPMADRVYIAVSPSPPLPATPLSISTVTQRQPSVPVESPDAQPAVNLSNPTAPTQQQVAAELRYLSDRMRCGEHRVPADLLIQCSELVRLIVTGFDPNSDLITDSMSEFASRQQTPRNGSQPSPVLRIQTQPLVIPPNPIVTIETALSHAYRACTRRTESMHHTPTVPPPVDGTPFNTFPTFVGTPVYVFDSTYGAWLAASFHSCRMIHKDQMYYPICFFVIEQNQRPHPHHMVATAIDLCHIRRRTVV